MQLHTQDVVDIRLRSWSVADSEDRAIGGKRVWRLCPHGGAEAEAPLGIWGRSPPRNWGISPNTFCVMA